MGILLCIVYILLISYVLFYLYNRWCIRWCRCKVCLTGRTAIITGANSGIGYQTALDLAMRGCKIIMADVTDCTDSREKIIAETRNRNIIAKKLDLQSLASVREFAKDILEIEKGLHILMCNAGIGSTALQFTEDGLQKTMQVNYFSHFLLVHLLLGLLQKSKPSRVIFTSSYTSYLSKLRVESLSPTKYYKAQGFISSGIYGNSKVAMACASVSFTRHFKDKGVTFNCLDPGGTKSNIFENAWKTEKSWPAMGIWILVALFGKSVIEGCQTSIHLACSNELEDESGHFFINLAKAEKPKLMADTEMCEKIWQKSIEIVQLKPQENLCK